MPLGTGAPHGDMDIPLEQVRSNASSTGARKQNQGISTGLSSTDTNAEKRHFFHRGRRQAKVVGDGTQTDRLASREVNVNFMGRMYKKVIGFSVVTRYLVYIVPVTILLAVPLIVLAIIQPLNGPEESFTHVGTIPRGKDPDGNALPDLQGPRLFFLFLWILCSWLAIWVGKLVAHLLAPIFMFFCGVVSAGTRKYATVIRALELYLSFFFAALASWLIFQNVFKDFDDFQWVWVLKRLLGAIFVSTAVLLGEKAIVQLIGISYHQRSFANRITDSKREVFLLGIMFDASRQLFPMYGEAFAEEDYIISDSIEARLNGGKKRNSKGGTQTPMALLAKAGGNVGRLGDKVTSIFGHVASEITGKQVFNPNSAHSIVVEALEKAKTSEALAKRIWMSFVVEGNDNLYAEDIQEVLGPAYREEADECFNAIDADGNGDISLDEMIRKVVEIGKERKAIAHSMKDIGQALGVFDGVLLFVVLLICVFVFLSFFQSSFLTTVATAGTALLSLSFVFAVTTQEFLGSCIFLFVKHPYDVGDRVDIVGPEKEQLTVERISLLYTVFNRIDKMQVVQVPNIVLNNLWIENVTRSKAMKEVIDVNVSYDTTFEDIELLRLEMEKFVRSSDNSRDFQPDIVVSCAGMGDLDKLNLKIAIKHKSNWHNEAVRASRRAKFMTALVLALKRVPIYAPGGGGEALGGPTNPSYSVTVSDSDAARARDKAAQDKEALRLVPTHPATAEDETRAAEALNARDPVTTAGEDWGFNRDDRTLHEVREESTERRSHDVEHMRLELQKTTSTRSGRRKAGDTLPSPQLSSATPNLSITQHMAPFDEEAQMGGYNPYTQNSNSPPPPNPYGVAPGTQPGYTLGQTGTGPSVNQAYQGAPGPSNRPGGFARPDQSQPR
ncbi:Mechanosensitive ion channel-domain-containing protein [Microdochium trichocladiopsis]|uniref:Mechanosensitive ion channel-domain-containing protein n=1 Tax=Microdochium trichocladiopsis TaxID=1682393 RepID=A0A9P8YJC2_9PEZI|nr:Mechanosensitive ion channel-domain-containing protein [Microdochium trichocladiopsis]KAH7040089.1 Mechanosensitive ion channel-domain-containing protein [Microdochium trichocladiopsis]